MSIKTLHPIKSFIKQTFDEKAILILTISVFLPFFITALTAVTVLLVLIFKKRDIRLFIHSQNCIYAALLMLLSLVTPLIYRNFPGLFAGAFFSVFLLLFFYLQSVMTDSIYDRMCAWICALSVPCLIMAVIQLLPNPGIRACSVFFNSNYYAFIAELIIPAAFYMMTGTEHKFRYAIVVSLNIAALMLTNCRSAWLSLIGGLAVFFLCIHAYRYFYMLLGVVLLTASFIYNWPELIPRFFELKQSSATRFLIWNEAWQEFKAHPVFGQGLLSYFHYSGRVSAAHAHNLIIDIAVNFGMIGSALLIIYIVLFLINIIGELKHSQNKRIPALILGILTIAFIHGITDVPVLGFQTGMLFLLLISYNNHRKMVEKRPGGIHNPAAISEK